jgi:hypothetical protein
MKKRPPAKPVAKKVASKKPPAKPAPKKAAKPKAKPKPAAVIPTAGNAEPHKFGQHQPSKPAPAYAQMLQRAWASKPPPHKIKK